MREFSAYKPPNQEKCYRLEGVGNVIEDLQLPIFICDWQVVLFASRTFVLRETC